MDEEFFERLKRRVLPYFEGINPCHDFHHTERVLDLALRIGEKEGCDLYVLRMAVLLHDVARKEQDDCKGGICHAKKGGELARDILGELEVCGEMVDRVVHCVEAHRNRGEGIAKSIEAKVLYDADKLDAIGAIGILRTTYFASSIGAVVHNPDIDIESTDEYSREDSAYREFLVSLRKTRDKMLTESGREIAGGRQDFMRVFFDRANAEVEGRI